MATNNAGRDEARSLASAMAPLGFYPSVVPKRSLTLSNV